MRLIYKRMAQRIEWFLSTIQLGNGAPCVYKAQETNKETYLWYIRQDKRVYYFFQSGL